MLIASDTFRDKVLNSPSFLEWQYKVKSGSNEYTSEVIKNLSITGQLQSQFTLGSSVSKSLELELLVNEKTDIPPLIIVEAILVHDRVYEEEDGVLIEKLISEPPLLVGTFYVTDVDRTTYGKLKIKAIDMMGHTDYLSAPIRADIFYVNITTIYEVIDAISEYFNKSFNPYYDLNIPKEERINLFPIKMEERYKIWPLTNFNNVPLDFTYRQLLEHMSGLCGCNVRLNSKIINVNDEDTIAYEIEFFRFKDTNVTLNADNFYNLTKGQYKFSPTSIVCTTYENNSVIIGAGKDSETIKMTNPYMTDTSLRSIYDDYCIKSGENYVEYYPISMDIIGTCLFEPGDIIAIEETYRSRDGEVTGTETFNLYIQDYKLSCNNGIKETLQSFFEYNKGSIANSISGKITQLNTELENTKTYIADNYINQTDFKITVEDLTTNIQYANDGLNKWIVEYYELTSQVDDYDLVSILDLEYRRRELIDDAEVLLVGPIYEGITVCRLRTGVYVKPENDRLFKDIKVVTSIGANVYINGEKKIGKASSSNGSSISDPYDITLRSGWNIVEIYVGHDRNNESDLTGIETFFWIKYEGSGEEIEVPYYHLTSTFTESEKEEEENNRTVVIKYLDFEGNTIKDRYEEKHKVGESYNVTERINEKYIIYDDKKYFYVETNGEPEGIVEDTTVITATYISEEYIYDNAYYYDIMEVTDNEIKEPYKAYIKKKSGEHNTSLNPQIDNWQLKEAVLEYRVYNDYDDKIDTTTISLITDEYSISMHNLIGVTRKFYYEEMSYIISTVNFVDYTTNEIVSTRQVSSKYGKDTITIEAPSNYRCIGDDSRGDSFYISPLSSVTLYGVNLGDTFTIYVIHYKDAYVSASVRNSYTNERNFFKAVAPKAAASIDYTLVYSIYGFSILSPGETIGSEHEYKIFNPKRNFISEELTIEYNGNTTNFESPTRHYISHLSSDVHINVVYRYSDEKDEVSYASLEYDFDTLPALDENKSDSTKEKIYNRFPYITLINPYVIDVNYKRVTEVQRLTNVDSIIDRITEKKYTDDKGNEYNGAEYLYKQSSVVHTIDSIEQRIRKEEQTSSELTTQMSDVNQTVDGFKLSFETALYGNYLSNSAFSTDDPLAGFNYFIPSGPGGYSHNVFTYTKLINEGTNTVYSTASRDDVGNYGFIENEYIYSYLKNNGFKGVVANDNENSYTSGNRTLSMGCNFKISQAFYKDEENFPFYKDNDSDEYFQFYMSIKAKRTENCTFSANRIDGGPHVYPYMCMSITFNYSYEEIIDNIKYIETKNYTINNLNGQPSKDEGIPEYGFEVDLDNLSRLEDYEIDTEWKQINFFINIPKDIFDTMISLNSITVSYEPKYLPSITKSYIDYTNKRRKFFDIDEIDIEMNEDDSIFICEPMFGTTKDYSALPFTTKKAELITGITNITQDGIQISRSNSKISTEIRNGGMTITHDGETVASFQEKTVIPELDVTKKITAPNIFINDYERLLEYKVIKDTVLDANGNIIDYIYKEEEKLGNEIPKEIIIDPYYVGDDLGYWAEDGEITKIAPVYNYFNDLMYALRQYGVIQLDKLTIRIKKDVGGVFPSGMGGGMGEAFFLENLRCGIIDIILEEDVELQYPIVLKNIEGTVRVRGPKEEHEIVLDDAYINGYLNEESGERVGRAPIVTNIISHNVRWLEVFGLNFSGGNDYPQFNEYFTGDSECKYDSEKKGWVTSRYPDMVFQTQGEFLTKFFHDLQFPLCDLYNNGTLEELNYIFNKTAIFIGYCNLVDISYCNFPIVHKKNDHFIGVTKYELGILGDHSDCYLSHNKGTFVSEYYRNRDKCWFRIPPEGLEEGIPSVQPVYPDRDGTSSHNLMNSIFPGGMIRKSGEGGTAIDHCYIGRSKDLAYLGSFQFTSGTDQSKIHPYTLSSNNTNYSRIRKSVKQKPLETLYKTTDGNFFGSFESIPGVSYSPNDTSIAAYTQHVDLKLTTLHNGLGVSIGLPDLTSTLKNKELRGARLVLEFQTTGGKLAEYGSTTAFGEYDSNSISSRTESVNARGGGPSSPIYNAGVSFGVRFVYDEAHYDGNNLRMGYYNMGKCTRAHEILCNRFEGKKSINTWAISDSGEYIHNIQNFSYMEGAEPYYVGTPLVTGEEYEDKTSVTIELGIIDKTWFTTEFMDSYDETFSNTSSGVVNREEFFDSLKGIASGLIKYIDIAPVGVRDCIVTDLDGNPAFPKIQHYANFSYDCTGDNESTNALATSCFKIIKADLILDTYNIAPLPPDFYTLTINFEDENGNRIKTSERVTSEAGSTIYIDRYKYGRLEGETCTYHYSHCKDGDINSIYLDSDKEITFVYLEKEVEYRIYIAYGLAEDSEQNNYYNDYFGYKEVYVKKGEAYDVSDYVKNPNKYGIKIDTYLYEYVKTDGDELTGIANSSKNIYVRYREYIGKIYTITINFLREPDEIVDGEYINTDGYKEELFERCKIAPTIERSIKHGAYYDLVQYIDDNQLIISDCIVDDFNGLEYEYHRQECNGGLCSRATFSMTLDIYYKIPYDVKYGAHAPYAVYTGKPVSSYKYENRELSMGIDGNVYVGILSRSNPDTVTETLYFRYDDDYHDNDNQGGSETYGYINDEVEVTTLESLSVYGNIVNGIEYIFNCDQIKNTFNNAGDIYLNIKFSKKSYAPSKAYKREIPGGSMDTNYEYCPYTDDLYYYIGLEISKTRKIQNIYKSDTNKGYIDSLHYGKSRIQLDNKNDVPSILSFHHSRTGLYSADYCTRYDSISNNIVNPFKVTGCSYENTDTYTQKIKLNDIKFPSEWYDIIEGYYIFTIDENRAECIHPDIFTNIDELVRRGMIVGVQVIPTNKNYYNNIRGIDGNGFALDGIPDPYSDQCLKVLDIWFSKE